jgi:membrane fusion protein, multidrug efflux system
VSFNKKLLLGVVVALVAVFGVSIARQVGKSKERDATAKAAATIEKVQSVTAGLVGEESLKEIVAITGTIKAKHEAVVVAKMPGRLTRVNVELGAVVRAGDVLASVESADMVLRVRQGEAQVALAKAGLEQATVQAEQAQKGFARAKALREKGSLSTVQVALAQSGLSMAQKAFDDTRVTAPFDGVIAKKNAVVGTEANPGQPLFTVQDQTTLKLEGTIPAKDISRAQKGGKVQVTVEELPGKIIEGVLTHVAPSLDEARRIVIEVSLPKTEGLLPYMFGSAEIAKGGDEVRVVVPAQAVLSSADGPLVYAIKDGKAVLVRPRLGARQGDVFVVDSGLARGDRVVTSGDTGIKDGVRVSVAGEG